MVSGIVPVITLTTDFGVRDWFVGTMKGVIAGINPEATVIDLTHEIPAGDIPSGAFALRASYAFFPKGTIHVAVVDPGVGSLRNAIAVQTKSYFFVGPDNGVLSWALAREKIKTCCSLTNTAYSLESVSRTFHGRDIFAPVAAHLSQGVPIRKLGPPLKSMFRLDWPEPRHGPGRFAGEIVYIDRFGNAITNLDEVAIRASGPGVLEVLVRGKKLCALNEFYQSVANGKPVAVLGSTGFVEIAINGGDAAQRFRLKRGDSVMVRATRVRR
jgi:hypothetical protein